MCTHLQKTDIEKNKRQKAMKKILLSLLLCMPLCMQAANNDKDKYLAGAVPEVNGAVVFQKSFKVPGHTDEQIRQTMLQFVTDSLVAEGVEGLRTRLISDGKSGEDLSARIEEVMVFKRKPLYLDRTRFRYQITVNVDNGRVNMNISQISYYYGGEAEGATAETYKAEEWITDKAAINKAGTKLYPRSGKFRIKTVDRVEEIFEQAISTFETEVPIPVKQAKTRRVVVEE